MKTKKILIIILIILSILIISIPPLINHVTLMYNQNKKDDLLNEVVNLIEVEEFSTTPIENTIPDDSQPSTNNTNTNIYIPYRTSTNEEIDGILKIPSIDLELPILTNVTENGLRITCARVTNTNPPGCKNYCIMGHNNDNYGEIFNRLKELKNNDIITVVARNYTYTYKVSKTFVTKGLDTSILKETDDNLITLFTCSYVVKDGRFVVQGKLIQTQSRNNYS